jgi:hypothetical protein
MPISWKKAIVVLFAALIISLVGYASARVYRFAKTRSHFQEVHEGQSKAEVVRLLGSPDEDVACYVPMASEDYRNRCDERFWYYGFIELWGVDFDAKGKVMGSFHNVSP